ncbi:MAG: hypothetical protein J5689_03295 [Clostridia bacterium]|nr:hypothetical protein [Clostridia bacterium]
MKIVSNEKGSKKSGALSAMVPVSGSTSDINDKDHDLIKSQDFDLVTDPKSLRYQLNEGDFYKDRFFHRLGLVFDSDDKMKAMIDSIGKESINKMCVAFANLNKDELDEIINSEDEELNREAFNKLVIAANQLFYFFKTGDEILQTRVDRQITNVENVETAVAFTNYVKSEQSHLEELNNFNKALDERADSFTDEAEKQDVKRFAVWVKNSIEEIKNSQTGKNLQVAALQATVEELEKEQTIVPVADPKKKKTLKQVVQVAVATILIGGALAIGVLLGNSKAGDKLRAYAEKVSDRDATITELQGENDNLRQTIEGQDLTIDAWEKRAKELMEENEAYRNVFPETADTNKDGVVSPEEGAAYLKELLENGLTQADLEAAKQAIREEYEDRIADLEERLNNTVSQDEYYDLLGRYNTLKNKYNNALDKLESLEGRVSELENLVQAKDETIKMLEKDLRDALENQGDPSYIADLQQQIADLQEENAGKDAIIDALQDKLDRAVTPEEKARLEKKIANLERENTSLKAENASLKAERDDILAQYLDLLAQMENNDNYQEVSDNKPTGGNEAVNASDENTDENGNPTDDVNHGGNTTVGQNPGEDEDGEMQN